MNCECGKPFAKAELNGSPALYCYPCGVFGPGGANTTAKPKSPTDTDVEAENSIVEAKPRRFKYGNVKEVVDGIKFDSGAEARRYGQLKLMEAAGVISGLFAHGPECVFLLHVNGVKVGEYRADFVYQEAGERVVLDVKGVRTAVYRLKKRMVAAEYGIDIKEWP